MDVTSPDSAFVLRFPVSIPGPYAALHGAFQEAQKRLFEATLKLATEAVQTWSAKCGMTPEQWLEIYTPEVALKPREAGESEMILGLVVRAKVRA